MRFTPWECLKIYLHSYFNQYEIINRDGEKKKMNRKIFYGYYIEVRSV